MIALLKIAAFVALLFAAVYACFVVVLVIAAAVYESRRSA